MLKKIIIAALMISAGLNGFSKSKTFDSEKAAIEVAKKEALEKLEEDVLSRMKQKLKSGEGKVNLKKGMKTSEQFLCQKNKIPDLYKNGKVGKKTSQLNEIINKLKDKAVRPSDFTFTKPHAGPHKIEENTESEVIYTFPISFEARTLTPSIGNHAKYEVSFYYTGKLKKKKEHPIVDGKENKTAEKVIVYEPKDAEFKYSEVKFKPIFDAESDYMKKKAAAKIVAWYKDVPANLDAKYAKYVNNNKGINPGNGNGVKINKQNDKTFTATGKPIEIRFVPEIDEASRYLYTDPIATISITPSFTIVFGDDLKTIVSENIVTDYKHKIDSAVTDSDKVGRYESARNAIGNFSNALSEYVADNSKANRENVKVMFVNPKKDEVAVSHRSKFNNKERINHRKAEKYLQRLNGNNLTFESVKYIDSNKIARLNEEYPELGLSYDPNLNTIMFDVIQLYDSKNYKDNTRKIVVMKKQDDNSFLVEKIIVVPNSTTIVE